jgi:hypothetical protein
VYAVVVTTRSSHATGQTTTLADPDSLVSWIIRVRSGSAPEVSEAPAAAR